MLPSRSSSISLNGIPKGLQSRHSRISLPILMSVQPLPTNVDEAGSETVAFLKSLDVLAKKGEKILHDVRFACLKNWFARSAWHEKLHFILSLLHCCEGTSLLRQLLICIARAGTKDAIFLTYMQSSGSLDDRILMDDNRDLDPDTLSNVRILDQIWFVGLEEDDKLTVLIGLLLIGGGIFSYRVYREALHILEERREIDTVLNNAQIIEATVEKESAENEEEEEKEEIKVQVTEKEKKKMKSKRKKSKEEILPTKTESEESTSDEVEVHKDVSPEEAALMKDIETQKAIWEAKLNAVRMSMVEQESEKNKKNEKRGKKGKSADKGKESENLDMLQLLPLSICKAVINMLDPQSVTVAKKVNSYWAAVVESTYKDKAARQKLDNVIAKINNIQNPSHPQVPEIPEEGSMSTQPVVQDKLFLSSDQHFSGHSVKLQSDQVTENGYPHTSDISHPRSIDVLSPVDKESDVSTSSSVQDETSSLPSSILRLHSDTPFDAFRSRRISFHDEKIRESFKQRCMEKHGEILELLSISQKSSSKAYKGMYSNKHSIVTIINDFLHLRAMTCGSGHRLMAVTDENHNVILFSLITGAKLTPCLAGHKSTITFLQFHPDGSHIITASVDNTVRYWGVWQNKTICSYIGHSGKITAISVSEEHVVVGSEDKLLRVYHVCSAYCLDSWQSDEVITALKLEGDGKFVYIGQENGNILMYNYNTHTVEMYASGHVLKVTGLHLSKALLLSSSYDGLVKVWKIDKPIMKQLIVLDHGSAVMNVNMVSTQVVSGCYEGCLWIWCLPDGCLLRKFQVWSHTQPIYHIYCADEKDHVKIVVSGEVGVKIYEFQTIVQPKPRRATPGDQDNMETVSKNLLKPLGSKYSNTKHLKAGLKNTTICKDLGQPMRVMLKTQRVKALDMRGSVDQALRYPMNVPVTKDCFVSKLCDRENKVFNPETGNLTSFPRLATISELYKLPLKAQQLQISSQQPTKSIKTNENKISHKNLLHYYNIQEIMH